ncbi:unnamed protein product [Absidia cylindrospora]
MQRNQNLERLRSNIMDINGKEEKVEVNQRHLIDKILARYSAEYVLYRELMQNADNASSTKIEIHFHTENSVESPGKLPNLATKCDKITFKNNGMAFRPENWQRLKRIAEGNPDEQKIGAFGVGFYSLFSVCENPFVFSGSQCMAFYFKGDQLFAKRADVPEEERNDWTSFLMDLREPMEMPDLDHFTKFLTTSMGFTANLRQISVYLDHHKLFHLAKQTADPRSMTVDARKVHTTSPKQMFTIVAADMRKIQLDAQKYVPPSMFSPLTNLLSAKSSSSSTTDNKDDLPMESASLFLRVVTGTLNVNVPENFIREMERSTKKRPPKTTKFQLVYTSKEELDASENKHHIFKDLMPFPNQGRVFIGFPTHQTTGCCSHMAARFIPTVERESIDFADRYLSVWNKELLSVGGLLSRLVYNDEMDQVDALYQELVGPVTEVDKSVTYEDDGTDNAKLMLEQRAAHTLHSFTFQPSTPSDIVSKVQEERFYQSSRIPLRLMTSHGVQPATVTRTLPDESFIMGPSITDLLNSFVKTIPTTTPIIRKQCKDGLQKLVKTGLLQYMGMMDVLKELDARSLSCNEMVGCMKWWIECQKGNQMIPTTTLRNLDTTRAKFFMSAVMMYTDTDGNEQLLQLSNAKWWLNPKIISLNMPVPDSTLPFPVSKALQQSEMSMYFGLNELSLLSWGKYIANDRKLETSAQFSEQVLSILTRGYNQLSSQAQVELCGYLKSKTCIPTKTGMKLASDTYFASVNLFDDLPTVHFQNSRHVGDQLLTMLGVRKHVDLQLIFDRLVSDGSWSHVDLVKYLTSVQSTLSSNEIRRLQETAIFTKEGEPAKQKEGSRPTGKMDEEGKPEMEKFTKKIYRRHKASSLYAPTDTLRNLQVPLIDWKGNGNVRWRQGSDEAKFMEKLGLRSSPPLQEILQLAAPKSNNNDRQLQTRALTYFIENRQTYSPDYDINKIDLAFLPCQDGKTYASPKNCFTNQDATVLNFQVLHQDLILVRDKLGVRENPSPDRLLEAFQQQISMDSNIMKGKLEYMAGRMGDFVYDHWEKLRNLAFIPVVDKRKSLSSVTSSSPNMLMVRPTECYFESDDTNFHKELFLFVNFGSLANSFLRSCGVKDEPTILELANMLVKDPQRFWNLCGGGERYLTVLRQIAGQYHQIKNHRKLIQTMKSQPCLVGIKRSTVGEGALSGGEGTLQQQEKGHSTNGIDSTTDDSKDEDFVQYRLAKASDIFIIDDTMGQHIFSPLSAPMEPMLEEFYGHLGSDRLSNQIKETYTFRETVGPSARSKAITDVIFERTGIIIYQMKQDYPQRQKELYRDEKYIKRNLKVIQAKELKINRVFKHTGEKDIQPTTACVDQSKSIIYISSAGEIDYYDVANALCYLIFTRVRFNDAIIAERYLTTSLKNLRRKGVPVDRILSINKIVENNRQPIISGSDQSPTPLPPLQPSLSAQQLNDYTKKVLEVFGDCQEGYVRQLLSQETDNHVERVIDKLIHEDYPRSQHSQHSTTVQEQKDLPDTPNTQSSTTTAESERSKTLMGRLLSWGKSAATTSTSSTSTSSSLSSDNKDQTTQSQQTEQLVDTTSPPTEKPKLPKSTQTITPNYTSSIKQNLRRAIHSCKPYSGQDMFSPPTINKVVESTQYCDATPGQNLTHVGQVKGLEFYVHRDVDAEQVLTQHGQAMQRFAHVVTGLANYVLNSS